MKQAVCIIIMKGDKILGVARRDNHEEFGLPGGKIDATDKSPKAAMVRELREETGLLVREDALVKVYEKVCKGEKDGVDYNCITYTCSEWSGKPMQRDAGPVRWCSKSDLMEGPFGKYNAGLFSSKEEILKTMELNAHIRAMYGKPFEA